MRKNITDQNITTVTNFNQAYLSKIYTSRDIEPWKLRNFLFVINRIFDVDITLESLDKINEA